MKPKERHRSVFDVAILAALTVTATLYVLQFWQIINVPLSTILLPVIIVAWGIILLLALAGVVVLLTKTHND